MPNKPDPLGLLYGARLRAVRDERKLRQVDVAASLGMSPGGYSSVERGLARMFVSDIDRYAEALGVPAAYLSRRLGLCGADTDDIASALVNRFGPQIGQALVRIDRILALMESDDAAALGILMSLTAGKYEATR